ncbi:MAG: hypothetical protein ACLQFR_02855 [Streptosporangiaceae bacterium]
MRRAMLIVLLLSVVSACAVQNPQAGQSGPPFYLWVMFLPHTSKAAATKVLSGCLHQPDVIRAGQLVTYHGALRGTVYTKDFGVSGRTKALLSCLHPARSVREAAWPD